MNHGTSEVGLARRAVGAPMSASLHFALTPKWLVEKEKAGAKREEFLIKRK